ncbi:MAG: DUF1049 domain-containing protein [Verrucomicrobiota bacterium]|nr:DUF1049 domain-containing protein [Verrucomicrobiota bacterium]
MSRKLLGALVLIALVVIVLLINVGGRVNLDFRLFELEPPRAIALFAFTAVGVIIGLLIK